MNRFAHYCREAEDGHMGTDGVRAFAHRPPDPCPALPTRTRHQLSGTPQGVLSTAPTTPVLCRLRLQTTRKQKHK